MVKNFTILIQVFALTAVTIIGLMIMPAISHACSCAELPSAQDDLLKKTAVFSGKVIAVKKPFKLLIRSSADPVNVPFDVDQVWTGDIGKKLSGDDSIPNRSVMYYTLAVGSLVVVIFFFIAVMRKKL